MGAEQVGLAAQSRVAPQPLPPPTGRPPYRLDIASVLDTAEMKEIKKAGKLTFHLVGDVGGVKAPQDQQIVAMNFAADAHRVQDPARFAYLMGDIVYYNGEATQYYPQFYEPYADYPCPIFSVPGNHDGTPLPGTSSLQAWMANFCTEHPEHSADARDVPRLTMTHPNCYWTLNTPFVTIVGLYTNVPENGYVDQNQANWFANELREAPTDRPLIVTAHHPALSLDLYHGGSAPMLKVIDKAITTSGRPPTWSRRVTCMTTNTGNGPSTELPSRSSWPERAATGTSMKSSTPNAANPHCPTPSPKPTRNYCPMSTTDTATYASPLPPRISPSNTLPSQEPKNPGTHPEKSTKHSPFPTSTVRTPSGSRA